MKEVKNKISTCEVCNHKINDDKHTMRKQHKLTGAISIIKIRNLSAPSVNKWKWRRVMGSGLKGPKFMEKKQKI